MFHLEFMGLAVLDPEFSRPMLPWVVREVIFRSEPREIKLSIENDQLMFQDANDLNQPPRVENSFHSDGYKIKDVYHPAHDPSSFAFVTREAASTPCSCYVFRHDSVDLVETLVRKLKLEVGSGKRKRLGETSGESEVISYEVALLDKRPIFTEKPSQDIIDSLIEISKIDSNRPRPDSADGGKFSVDIVARNRGLTSSDIAAVRSDDYLRTAIIDKKRPEFTRQRSHSYDTSHFKQENKTKIFQIGIDRLTIIDTDGPGVLDVKFTRVSRCVQGVKHPNCFGFVARDPRKRAQPSANGKSDFYFHIFQCFDEQTCEDIMSAIKQSFSASLRPVTPLHTFHRLCVRLNHSQDLNQRLGLVSGIIEQISEGEKFYIDQKLKSLTPGNGEERLVFQVSVLREIFEVKNREQQLSISSSKKAQQNSAGLNASKVEDLAVKLGSKFSLLSRNMTQNVQKMSDKLGESGMNLAGKVRTGVQQATLQRPDSRITIHSNAHSTYSDDHRTQNGLGTPTRDIEEISFESNDVDSVQHFSPLKSLRQHIYESVSANATITNSPRPSYTDREIKKDLSSPGLVRQAVGQFAEENSLLESIKSRIAEIEAMSAEDTEPHLKQLWRDLGVNTDGHPSDTPSKLVAPCVLHAATIHGVPDDMRGDVWRFLVDQRERRHGRKFESSYSSLINQLAPPNQAHSILIDLCRTFPKHRQFRESLAQSTGQKSLYNVLKAYCLLDDEVGYCQGLSFVVGLILIYLPSEEDAFAVLRHLMYECDMRRYYMPDMAALQEAMYQLSRLLSELEPELYNFLETHCVTPVLYLTPWFLTMFASNYPLDFASRVLDLVLAHGSSSIFKISLSLFQQYKAFILKLDGFEQVADFIKNHINCPDKQTTNEIFKRAGEIDLGTRLDVFGAEYLVLSEHDLIKEPGQLHWSPSKNLVKDLRIENRKFREQLTIQETQIQALQDSLEDIQDQALQQKNHHQIVSELVAERNNLKLLVQKLSEQLGNLSAEQSLSSSRVASPT